MIQIDMAMPESCAECRFSQGGYMYCHAMPEDFCGYVNYCEEDGKPEWCPLKAQEPVAPELQSGGNYVCGACGVYTVGFMHPLTGESVQTWKYCGKCGKKVRWE